MQLDISDDDLIVFEIRVPANERRPIVVGDGFRTGTFQLICTYADNARGQQYLGFHSECMTSMRLVVRGVVEVSPPTQILVVAYVVDISGRARRGGAPPVLVSGARIMSAFAEAPVGFIQDKYAPWQLSRAYTVTQSVSVMVTGAPNSTGWMPNTTTTTATATATTDPDASQADSTAPASDIQPEWWVALAVAGALIVCGGCVVVDICVRGRGKDDEARLKPTELGMLDARVASLLKLREVCDSELAGIVGDGMSGFDLGCRHH